jgi:hypothetical protein
MDNQPPRTERGLRSRQAEAQRVMRRAEWAAYVQAIFSVVAYVAFAIAHGDWLAPLYYAGMALVLSALGYLVGRRHSATAAGVLVALVLGLAVLQLLGGGRPPALLFVAIFAWLYGRAFTAAREYATLKVVPLDSGADAT